MSLARQNQNFKMLGFIQEFPLISMVNCDLVHPTVTPIPRLNDNTMRKQELQHPNSGVLRGIIKKKLHQKRRPPMLFRGGPPGLTLRFNLEL
jgi:hypothetical protein